MTMTSNQGGVSFRARNTDKKRLVERLKTMLKVLVIDDNPAFLDFLVELIKLKGFQAIAAYNGYSGFNLAEAQRPDLIISDIQMPMWDGYQLLKALRQNPLTQNIPVIILSAEVTDSVSQKSRDLGANDCLNKFCEFQELIDVIDAQINVLNIQQ